MATLNELERQIERVDNHTWITDARLEALEQAFTILWRIQPESVRDSVVGQLRMQSDLLGATEVEDRSIAALNDLARQLNASLVVPKKPD